VRVIKPSEARGDCAKQLRSVECGATTGVSVLPNRFDRLIEVERDTPAFELQNWDVLSVVGGGDPMARNSTDAVRMFQNAYDRSKDFIGTLKDESRTVYKDARRWVPEHPTVVVVSASAALCIGVFGFTLGRRRRRQADAERGTFSAAMARAPELDLSPFFKFIKLWMMYRVATKD